ncbi:MAG: hypothetical protein MZU95_03460 [Desulfomicrobium escambiense]|nr:hypothetical protein [Desulfomicrobium escambiense]
MTFDVRSYTPEGDLFRRRSPTRSRTSTAGSWPGPRPKSTPPTASRRYLFETVRSTPELSFAIRHLKAIAGDMFSASHNLPPDNGKKVYDEYGGQLIPPHDQALVDEVTGNVTAIQRLAFDEARRAGPGAIFVGEEIDRAYHAAVRAVSLSAARGLQHLLLAAARHRHHHGLPGAASSLGFDVTLCPATSNLSGAFEKVTFNIPNPEVVESFSTSLPLGADRPAPTSCSAPTRTRTASASW